LADFRGSEQLFEDSNQNPRSRALRAAFRNQKPKEDKPSSDKQSNKSKKTTQFSFWSLAILAFICVGALLTVPILVSAADFALELNQTEFALTLYTTANSLDQHNFGALSGKARAENTLHEYRKAIEDENRAIAIRPNVTDAYANRGFAHYRLRENAEALDDFSHALELDPQHSEIYLRRGVVYARMGRFSEAFKDYSIAMKLNPMDAEAASYRSWAMDMQAMTLQANSDPKVPGKGLKNQGPSVKQIKKLIDAPSEPGLADEVPKLRATSRSTPQQIVTTQASAVVPAPAVVPAATLAIASITPSTQRRPVQAHTDASASSHYSISTDSARHSSGTHSESAERSVSSAGTSQANYTFPGIQFYVPPGWMTSPSSDPQAILTLRKDIPGGTDANIRVRKINTGSADEALKWDEDYGKDHDIQTRSVHRTSVGLRHLDAILSTHISRKDQYHPFRKHTYVGMEGLTFCFILDAVDESQAATLMAEYEQVLNSISGAHASAGSAVAATPAARTQTYRWANSRGTNEPTQTRPQSSTLSAVNSPTQPVASTFANYGIGGIRFYLPPGWVPYKNDDKNWLWVFYKDGAWIRARKLNTNSIDQAYSTSDAWYRQNACQTLKVSRSFLGARHSSGLLTTAIQKDRDKSLRMIHCAYTALNGKVICFELNSPQADDPRLAIEFSSLLKSVY
jgi:tetratricopeptide (TPR) repeat protein